MTLSVVVPVYNEARVLPVTAPMLLDGLKDAEVIFVCNGCTDQSREVLESCVRGHAKILDLPVAGKALAIREAESQLTSFPRFYVDADVRITGTALTALASKLRNGNWELISPRLVVDSSNSTLLARWIGEIWLALPHGQSNCFHNVLGVSAAGRSRWGLFPDLLADDAFITAQIPKALRLIDKEVSARIRLPGTFRSWVLVRARWARGQRQLRHLGLPLVTATGQRRALLKKFCLGDVLRVTSYVAVKLLAEVVSRVAVSQPSSWYQDESSRAGSDAAALL